MKAPPIDWDAAGSALTSLAPIASQTKCVSVGAKKVLPPIRQETVSIRGIVAGEYTVNV